MNKPKVVRETRNIFDIHDDLANKAIDCIDKNTGLSKSEIQRVIKLSTKSRATMQVCLLSIDQKKSWRLYGCKSMKEFMQQHFPKNYDALNRNLVAARVTYQLGGVKLIGQFSDNAMQPLNTLSKEKCEAVMTRVKEDFVGEYNRAHVTKKLVLEAMYKLELKPRPSSKIKEPKDPFKDLATRYTHSPKSFIPSIAEKLLKNMKPADLALLIKTLRSGIKKR